MEMFLSLFWTSMEYNLYVLTIGEGFQPLGWLVSNEEKAQPYPTWEQCCIDRLLNAAVDASDVANSATLSMAMVPKENDENETSAVKLASSGVSIVTWL